MNIGDHNNRHLVSSSPAQSRSPWFESLHCKLVKHEDFNIITPGGYFAPGEEIPAPFTARYQYKLKIPVTTEEPGTVGQPSSARQSTSRRDDLLVRSGQSQYIFKANGGRSPGAAFAEDDVKNGSSESGHTFNNNVTECS